jgi:hypothetical protein
MQAKIILREKRFLQYCIILQADLNIVRYVPTVNTDFRQKNLENTLIGHFASH